MNLNYNPWKIKFSSSSSSSLSLGCVGGWFLFFSSLRLLSQAANVYRAHAEDVK